MTTTTPTAVEKAEACRWDGLSFGKCTFKIGEMDSWLDTVRTQLYTRKAAFMLSGRKSGDDHLQTMCLLALKASLPTSKRPQFDSYKSFTDAFKALEAQCKSATDAAALTKQAELTNICMKSSETLTSYIDRGSELWGSLVGSSQEIQEESAIMHTLRGLNSSHSWFLALCTASLVKTFSTATELAMRHATSRVATSPEMNYSSQVHGRHKGRGYRGQRPHCSTCNRHHFQHEPCRGPRRFPQPNHAPRPPVAGRGNGRRGGANCGRGPFQHTIGNAEFCTVEFNTVASAIECHSCSDEATLSLCVDSGATHVVTPDASFLSNYQALSSSSDSEIKLATTGTACAPVGVGTLTIRSRSTGSTLRFTNALHVPNMRRTLICLGKSMKNGVFWHFDSKQGGYLDVEGQGYWGDIILTDNDLLFLSASIVTPLHSQPECGLADSTPLSTAELFHRRLGHPGRTVVKYLAAKRLIPTDAASPVPDHCTTCTTSKATSVPRAPLQNPATAPLQRLHADLITVSVTGFNGEQYVLVLTDQYSGYIDAVPLLRKSDAADAIMERILFYERQLQPLKVVELFSDRGGEFTSTQFIDWCLKQGIQQSFTPPYTSRSNGRAENANLHLEVVTRSLMTDMSIPPDLWPEVVRHGGAYLLNRRPRRIQGRMQVPFTAFTGKKVSYAHLRIIGSPCAVLHKPLPRNKFAPRSKVDGILLGYASDGRQSTCLYRIWLPAEGRAISVVDVHVMEPSLLRTPQMPRDTSAGEAIPAEPFSLARESDTSTPVLVPCPTPPVPPVLAPDRHGSGAGGGQGPSPPGVLPAHPSVTPVPAVIHPGGAPDTSAGASSAGFHTPIPTSNSAPIPTPNSAPTSNSAPLPRPPASAPSPLSSGARLTPLPAAVGRPLPRPPPAASPLPAPACPVSQTPHEPASRATPLPTPQTPPTHTYPVATPHSTSTPALAAPRSPGVPSAPGPPAPGPRRSSRPNLGVPAATFDGSARYVETTWTPSVPARNYLAEVQAVTGEDEVIFDTARTFIATSYTEVLLADAAPGWQREAPRTLSQALARPDADAWHAAMQEELAALQSKGVYEVTDLPTGHQPIDLRWVFTYKLRPDGAVERHKARLVAKGYTQQEGIDYYEVWAPTGRLAAYRTLLAHAASNDLPVLLLDFKTAFLNGRLHEEIYVSQPPGFHDGSSHVWRLHRALYGLKQAANAWHSALHAALCNLGYTPSCVDPAVYVRHAPSGVLILHTHVDDCAGTGPPAEVQSDFESLLQQFDGRLLGEIHNQMFLGMYHERDWEAKVIYISNPRQIEKILADHNMSTCKGIASPFDHKVHLQATTEYDKCEHPKLSSYAAIVGALMYISCATRPDLSFTASMLARFMANPSDQHLSQAIRALRYLSKTRHARLVLGGIPDSSTPLQVWSDSDHAGCVETSRSTSGLVVSMLGSSVIYWRSARQSTVAKSTMLAEYYAASTAADEAVYFRHLLTELGYTLPSTPLMCDNRSACVILQKPIVNDMSRYARVNAHYVRERIDLGELEVVSAKTDEMIADVMTKALSPDKHIHACHMLRILRP